MGELSEQGSQDYSYLGYQEMLARIFRVAELLNKGLHKDQQGTPEVGASPLLPAAESKVISTNIARQKVAASVVPRCAKIGCRSYTSESGNCLGKSEADLCEKHRMTSLLVL